MNGDLKFTDTNLFLYAFDDSEPMKKSLAEEWLSSLWNGLTGRISFQVLHEFYSVIRRKRPQESDDARLFIRDLLRWHPISQDGATIEAAWRIQDRYQLSWWDSLIVAAAQAQDCRYLLSEDLQHEQSFDSVTVLNPFLTSPADLT